MSKNTVTAGAAVLAFGIAVGNVSSAHAGGFIADIFIRPFDPGLAQKLDHEHAKLGKPLDHLANGAAGAAVGTVTGNPAAGIATTTVLEARD